MKARYRRMISPDAAHPNDAYAETEVVDPPPLFLVFPIVRPGRGLGQYRVKRHAIEHSRARCGPGCEPVVIYT